MELTESVPMPGHEDMADLLLELGALQPPAELHGYLTGQLAVGARLDEQAWTEQLQAFLDCRAPDPEQRQALRDLYSATLARLEDGQMDLELLLPDEEVDLDQRVESLGHWCQGFLAGFALAGKQRQRAEGQQQFSDDISEVLSDLAAISQVGLQEDEEQSEESENRLVEIIEYVRVAVLNVFVECNAPAKKEGAAGSDRRVH